MDTVDLEVWEEYELWSEKSLAALLLPEIRVMLSLEDSCSDLAWTHSSVELDGNDGRNNGFRTVLHPILAISSPLPFRDDSKGISVSLGVLEVPLFSSNVSSSAGIAFRILGGEYCVRVISDTLEIWVERYPTQPVTGVQ